VVSDALWVSLKIADVWIRNESFSFHVVPGTEKFTVNVFGKLSEFYCPVQSLITMTDHHTIGKDEDLGEAEIDVSLSLRQGNASNMMFLRSGDTYNPCRLVRISMSSW
jgi:hypothetical protein